MRFFTCSFLFLTYGLISNDSVANVLSSLHADQGKLLDFDATNFDAGSLYIGDDISPYFSFVNRSGHAVRIKDVSANNGSYRDPFRLTKIDSNRVIKPGQRDTLFFERYFSTSTPKLGSYDLSFTVKFMDSHVKQHLNIFCILKENKGEVIMDTVALRTVDLGDITPFSTTIKNSGSDVVTFWPPNHSEFTKYLDQYPVKLKPNESRVLNFEVNTSSFPNWYDKKIYLKTNVNDKHVLSIPIKGKVIAHNRADIYFEKKISRLDLFEGGPAIYHFWYTNTGDMPLIISMCKGSCGCIVPNCSKEPLAPGDSAEVLIKYDSKRIGPINKSVTVYSNAVTPRIVLRVTGNVTKKSINAGHPSEVHQHEPQLNFKTKNIFLNYRYKEHKTAVYSFINEGKRPVSLHLPHYPGGTIVRLSNEVIPPGGIGWIAAEYNATRIGPFSRNISLGINGIYYHDFLEFSGNVRAGNDTLIPIGPQIAFKKALIYGKYEYGGDAQEIYPFTNTGDEDLIITTLKPSGNVIANCKKKRIKPGESGEIKVKYDTRRLGTFRKHIDITHNAVDGKSTIWLEGNVAAKPKSEVLIPTVNSNKANAMISNSKCSKGKTALKFKTLVIEKNFKQGDKIEAEFLCYNSSKNRIEITKVIAENGGVWSFAKGTIGPNQENKLYVSYTLNAIGPFSRTIVLFHSASENPVILTLKGVVL